MPESTSDKRSRGKCNGRGGGGGGGGGEGKLHIYCDGGEAGSGRLGV